MFKEREKKILKNRLTLALFSDKFYALETWQSFLILGSEF